MTQVQCIKCLDLLRKSTKIELSWCEDRHRKGALRALDARTVSVNFDFLAEIAQFLMKFF